MMREKEESKDFGMPIFEDFSDGENVAKRFGHLFLVDVDKAVMDPVPDKGFPGSCLGLSNLIFVVRENEIPSAPVDIQGLA